MIPNLNNVRLRDKMLLLYFLCVFVPILLTNFIFYNVTTASVKNQRMQDISRALEQVKNEFLQEVEDTLQVSSVFYTDHLLNEIIETKYEHPAEYVEVYDSYLRRIINTSSPAYNSVDAITVYVDNPTLLYSGGIVYIDQNVKQQDWYREISSAKPSAPILMRTGQNGQLDTFSVIRRMDYYYYSRQENGHFLKIDMRMPIIHQIFNNLNLQGRIYLLNDRGEVEYSNDADLDLHAGAVPFEQVVTPERTIEFHKGYGQSNHLTGWSIVGRISEDEVFQEVRQNRNFIVLLTCLNILLPTLIIVWITRSLNVRLVRILKHMKKLKNQHFETIQDEGSSDEIGQLTGEFNRMTLQIQSLINNVYVADIQRKNLELERRHAQLNALQSQINPHFLFNALETIRMRSLMKDEEETARIIHNMAKIFRNSLVWRRDMVTLKEELDFIYCFLEIQKYRFGDKIEYTIRTNEADLSISIPKMSIVTFVENASIHGIEPLKQGGKIEVEIRQSAGELFCTIRDNGVGMSGEQVEKLHGYLIGEEEMGERIGIQNVIYRLRMYYKDGLNLKVRSKVGEGTEIHLTIPIEKHENKNLYQSPKVF
ncbi:sensor histidine kinase [Paenibacillus lentus]|uniref:Sensor histidine kinase n=1 Tax=Paenibacillus lentus TaxID=1338368 RepID=A0A3S8RTF0_9BACL|nr:sensor histidine kinase [Paenibacillus lentus]AZK46395.1 sensor histidine kinase [Paenibacillus lentus]